MKDLPRELAFEIYSKQYWDINKLDAIALISEKI
jgi:lysozyme family protein